MPSSADLAARLFNPDRPALLATLRVLTNAPEEHLARLIRDRYAIEFDYVGTSPGEWEYQAPWEGGAMHCGLCAHPNPRAAWEALATRGVIPLAWVDDPRRRFVCAGSCPACVAAIERGELPRARCPECARGITTPTAYPPTVRACYALASDPPGVARAEALAREVAAAQGRRDLGVIHWRVVGHPDEELLREAALQRAEGLAPDAAYLELLQTGYLMDPIAPDADALTLVARVCIGAAPWWS